MRALKIGKVACVVGFTLACVVGLSACSGEEPTEPDSNSTEPTELTGGVAATVNGVEIQEDTITSDVQRFRTSAGMTDEDSWGQWLVDYNLTPEDLREQTLEPYIEEEVLKVAAKENKIEIPQNEIDGHVNNTKANYKTDEEWQTALEKKGITEQDYRDSIEMSLIKQKVEEKLVTEQPVTDEDVLELAKEYSDEINGAKRSSYILFSAENKGTAQEVLGKLKSGELDFEEAVKSYSEEDGADEHGGDAGWDLLGYSEEDYAAALAVLEKGQISELVENEEGIKIIKCTDTYVVPDNVTSLDQFPAEFVDALRASLDSSKEGEGYKTWYEGYKKKIDVVINPMPKDVPYNVDVTKYTPSENSVANSISTEDVITPENQEEYMENTGGTTEETTGPGGEATTGEQPAEAA